MARPSSSRCSALAPVSLRAAAGESPYAHAASSVSSAISAMRRARRPPNDLSIAGANHRAQPLIDNPPGPPKWPTRTETVCQ